VSATSFVTSPPSLPFPRGKEGKGKGQSQPIALLLAALFCLVFPVALTGRPAQGDQKVKQAKALFSGLIAAHEPGAAFAVVKDGVVLLESGYGVTDLRTRRPIGAGTNFRLASVTKQFTAAAVMILVRDGKLRLKTAWPASFPHFPEYGRAITTVICSTTPGPA
jgi:CubicO group peptidase (beta-lactamase class C family)